MALDFPTSPTIGQSFTGPDGTVWTWDGVKWVGGASASGLITAQQIDYDPLRLTAVGTKLKALGPVGAFNQPAAGTSPALDGKINSPNTTGAAVWNLPPGVSGMCLGIMPSDPGHSTTVVPNGSDIILTPGGGTYTNASPLVIPATPKIALQPLLLMFGSGAWALMSIGPEIAEAMGWVSRPVFSGAESNGGVSFALVAGLWTRINLDFVATDTHGWWISNGYKPKRAGRYRIQWECHLGDTATGSGSVASVYAAIYLNGTLLDYRSINQFPGQALPAVNFCSVSALISMNGTTDFVEPWVQVSATASQFICARPNVFHVSYVGS